MQFWHNIAFLRNWPNTTNREEAKQCMFIVGAVVDLRQLKEFWQCFAPSAMTFLPIFHLALLAAVLSSVAGATLLQVDSNGTLAIIGSLLSRCPTSVLALGVECRQWKQIIKAAGNDLDCVQAFNAQPCRHVKKVVLLSQHHTHCVALFQ